MERYDFTVNAELAGNVPAELDQLTNKEMIAVYEAIQQITQNTETEAAAKYIEWFDTAIRPILKEYAEQTSSILDIERNRETLIQATLRNSHGLDISSDDHGLYMAVMSAVNICTNVEGGDPVLVLTYDLNKS